MVQIQTDLPTDVNEDLEDYNAKHRLKDKRKALIKALRTFFAALKAPNDVTDIKKIKDQEAKRK